ncbi:hypothetical protein nbrc107697_12680 [Gordonia crocea]|uniref:ESX-1 secretion-associated protein n=2 Tax=Gordonia crocea TaxID=589162 RepID=A0A7I9UW66_9ACTN|nr:hypothetical protein nbrc107697_12680 [Gordonia crocea]
MEPFGAALRLRDMGALTGVMVDAGEAARLAADCRRVADAIDEQVALLRGGAYGGLRRGSPGYRPAVDAVVARLSERADELRCAARGLTAQCRAVADADSAAAHRILDLASRSRGGTR